MVSDFGDKRRRLAADMERREAWLVRSPWIRKAVDALPRDQFAPERLWCWNGHSYVPVDRLADPGRWADLVYTGPDEATITQVSEGLPSSSLSCVGVVVDMLDSLLLEPGHRGVELGTGTGWNAALLAWRAGRGLWTSVEVDPDLADAARRRLDQVDAGVSVEIGDGAAGWPSGAPYDRLISTYAVEEIPWAWVVQTRPGGRIVTPWGHLGHVALTVADDGTSATGWVQGLAEFMPARGSRAPLDYQQIRGDQDPEDERPVARDLRPLREDLHLRFALRVALPDVRITTGIDEDGINAWLHDGVSSWCALSAQGSGRTIAYQGGPRRLADELEQAWDQWLTYGQPELWDYGMTVEPDRQFMWCRDPAEGPRWPITKPDQIRASAP
ncbi:MAG: protein-L-isoaspartate O-methyltransferase [Streptomycetaceae bacterium]|nr:protein-L-isoaspartate O-methyltransferase [Streptomycetaceae bacterium]